MILLTKLDKSKVLVSLDNIKFIESTPDTLIRFVNGDLLLVSESLEEIAQQAMDFKTRCLVAAQSQDLSAQASTGGLPAWT
jgi:uncharacterized protein YlzI (FlbEa/FlbD family)